MKGCILFTVLLVTVVAARADLKCVSGSHIPHPTDCRKYYTCDNGQPVLHVCPDGLWWNQALEVCDFPENTVCTIEGTTTSNPGGSTSTTTSGPASTTDGSLLPDCHGASDTLLPHPTDCTKFYKCLEGIPVLQSCPPGLWWHQEILACDWPEQSECTPGVTGSTPPTEGTTRPPTGPTTTTIATTTDPELPTEPPAGLPDHCPEQDEEGVKVRLPHETNCRFYYLCMAGTPTLYTCPPDEHFSPTRRACFNKAVAGCDSCPAQEDDVDGDIRLPHESDCHLYYHCERGQKVLYQCRYNLHFSRFVRECLEQVDAKCTLGSR